MARTRHPTPNRRPGQVVQRRRRPIDGNRSDSDSFRSQIKRHSVALISLVIAVASLGYNTWRNETSELHRNWRQAAFQITTEVNELQQIVLYRRYFHARQDHPLAPQRDAETWISGWGTVIGLRDLTSLLPEPLPETGERLHSVWGEHAGRLDEGGERAEQAEQALLEAIETMRMDTLALIQDLR